MDTQKKSMQEEIVTLRGMLADSELKRQLLHETVRTVAKDRDGWRATALRLQSDRAFIE